MSVPEEREAIVRLYEAASGEGLWNVALDLIATLVGAQSLVLFSQLPGAGESSFLGGVGVTPHAMSAYKEYYCARNVLMQHCGPLLNPGVVRTSETICRADTILRSEYYNDFMRPNGQRFALGITADRGDSHAVHLSGFRPPDRNPFGLAEQHVFATLYPHLRQAVRMSAQLESAQTLMASLHTVGDALDKGVALLDARGTVLLCNSLFEQMCAEKDGLQTIRKVVTVDRASASAFAAVFASAVAGGAGGTIHVARRSRRPPYSILVSPMLRRVSAIGAVAPSASLIVTDAARAPRIDVLGLQRQFRLTRAEARFVSRLARGVPLQDICHELRISISTGRTHLKRAMAKLGVSRQAELVRVLLTWSPLDTPID